jgi:DNA polymerase-3 subunit gamma/tau
VGATIRNRYLEQASRCPADILLRALDIGNRTDINYKSSNNKRLHLELALMQMCSLSRPKEAAAGNGTAPVIALPREENPPVTIPPKRSLSTASGPRQPQERKNGDAENGTARKPTKGTGLSIKERIENNNNHHDESADNHNGAVLVEKLSEPFTQEELETIWAQFTGTLTRCNPILLTTLSRRKPFLKEDFTIEFSIDNAVQEDELRSTTLLAYLRKHLRNDHIQLVTLLNKDHSDLKPYTPEEKYKKMVEKNPDLKTLREKLDLDIDF